MDKLDRMITEALAEEDRDIVARTAEPGIWRQTAGLFRGRNAWVAWWIIGFEIALTVVAVWAGWHFFVADAPLAALKWGLPALAATVTVAVIEMSWLRTLEANRVIRELKRVELMLAAREK